MLYVGTRLRCNDAHDLEEKALVTYGTCGLPGCRYETRWDCHAMLCYAMLFYLCYDGVAGVLGCVVFHECIVLFSDEMRRWAGGATSY